MPLWEISSICYLSEEQQDKLAQAVTSLHSEKFNVPTLLVNVTFTNVATTNAYVAGKRSRANLNMIKGWLRSGPSRTKDDYDDLNASLARAWEEIVGSEGVHKLGGIFMVGGVLSARESGFLVPAAGGYPGWIKENYVHLKQRADAGEELMVEFLHELRTRECFRDLLAEAEG